jgi:hypothetical protein
MIPILRLFAAVVLAAAPNWSQVIEFESGGLHYQTLTKNGLTIMFAHLPAHVREYAIVQVAVSNGSSNVHSIRPEDCLYKLQDGNVLRAAPARTVVDSLLQRASRGDVVKMVSTYELSLYGLSRFQSTNGYEQRRQSALAEVSSGKLKAAAAASAIAFVASKLGPGQSTDGAVFFPTGGRPIGPGRLVFSVGNDVFEFHADGGPGYKSN